MLADALRCAPPGTLDPEARIGPMNRQDIDALINLPGPAVTEGLVWSGHA